MDDTGRGKQTAEDASGDAKQRHVSDVEKGLQEATHRCPQDKVVERVEPHVDTCHGSGSKRCPAGRIDVREGQQHAHKQETLHKTSATAGLPS